MAPLQVIILLLLVRLPATLAGAGGAGGAGAGAQHPVIHSWFPPFVVVSSFVLSHVMLVAFVFVRAKRAVREIHETTGSASALASHFEHLLPYARWGTILFTGVHLYVPGSSSIPSLVGRWLGQAQMIGRVPLVAEMLYVAPAVLAWLAFWTAAYFVEAAYRERSLPYKLASNQPAHEMPTLWQYLLMQVRHNFYLVVPIGLIALIQEITDRLPLNNGMVAGAINVGAFLLLMFLMLPWIVIRIWATAPLQGPLRHRLDALARHYHLRFKNILLWKTHNAVTNAAILGYLPFSRYFLMTDALLETLTDQQIEAVFAHEVGHGVHRHLWWYLTGFVGAIFLTGAASDLVVMRVPLEWLANVDANSLQAARDKTSLVIMLLMLLPFLVLGFPWVSHRFEHQADYFAAKHMAMKIRMHPESLPIPAAALVEPTEAVGELSPELLEPPRVAVGEARPEVEAAGPMPASSADPAVAGTEMFISSLDAIVDLAHRSRNKRGWMHPSINHRIELLRRLAVESELQDYFARRMKRTRQVIVVFLGVSVAVMAYSTWEGYRHGPQGERAAPQRVETEP